MRHLIIGMAVLALSATASAQETKWHVGLGYSFAQENFDGAGGVDFDNSQVIAFQGGYRLNEHWVVEGEFDLIDGFDLDFSTPVPGDGEVDGWMLMASGKYFPMPGAQKLQPFLMGGLGYMDGEVEVSVPGVSAADDGNALVIALGFGANYPVSEHWLVELAASYKFPTSDLSDLEFWTLGLNLQYRF